MFAVPGRVAKWECRKAKLRTLPYRFILCSQDLCRHGRNTTSFSQPGDWVFASFKCKGKQPRVANMLVESHLRPAAVKAGVLVKDAKVRFGFHNLRHSLASFLVRTKTDPKTVQALLQHSDVKTTLQLYAHSISEDRMAAQGQMLEAILRSSSEAVN
jgi:integrase